MNRCELDALVGVASEPEKCVYDISNPKNVREIQRIMRIFEIEKEQKLNKKCFSLFLTFKMVLNNN